MSMKFPSPLPDNQVKFSSDINEYNQALSQIHRFGKSIKNLNTQKTLLKGLKFRICHLINLAFENEENYWLENMAQNLIEHMQYLIKVSPDISSNVENNSTNMQNDFFNGYLYHLEEFVKQNLTIDELAKKYKEGTLGKVPEKSYSNTDNQSFKVNPEDSKPTTNATNTNSKAKRCC